MLEILKTVTPSPEQWEIVIEGMRNPMNSWANMDTVVEDEKIDMGEADKARMFNLAKGGPVHAKYRRMLPVHVTINAPLYWWKEFETYRTGVAPNPTDIELNSCSTMHKVTEKEFVLTDFGSACEMLERNQVDVQEVLPKILEIAQKYDLQWVDYELHAKCLEQDVSKCWGRMVEAVMLVCEIGV